MDGAESKAESQARNPKALSPEYHKAHKQLMLWAGILLIWELVGVDLENAKHAGGNIGPLVTSIKSPQAVPWVLLIIAGYFLFKLTVEWRQCTPDRRTVTPARLDFWFAVLVSFLAYGLYFFQTTKGIQIANLPRGTKLWSFIVGFIIGVVTIFSTVVFQMMRNKAPYNREFDMKDAIFPAFGLILLIVLAIFFIGPVRWTFALGIFIGMALLITPFTILISRIRTDDSSPAAVSE
jgi:hypothetical protein